MRRRGDAREMPLLEITGFPSWDPTLVSYTLPPRIQFASRNGSMVEASAIIANCSISSTVMTYGSVSVDSTTIFITPVGLSGKHHCAAKFVPGMYREHPEM